MAFKQMSFVEVQVLAVNLDSQAINIKTEYLKIKLIILRNNLDIYINITQTIDLLI